MKRDFQRTASIIEGGLECALPAPTRELCGVDGPVTEVYDTVQRSTKLR